MRDNKENTPGYHSSPKLNTPQIFRKIIKRYQNRKLYDTEQSCYVTLDDIQKMIKADEKIVVIDNKSKRDITAATLIQIIFEAEKKVAKYPPLSILREIIQHSNGNLSSFLFKLGVLKTSSPDKEDPVFRYDDIIPKRKSPRNKKRSSLNDPAQTLEERVAHAALLRAKYSFSDGNSNEKEDPPHLPNPNHRFSN